MAIHELKEGAVRPSFVRSFAYASGPAYGLLLDESGTAWRSKVASRPDLGTLLAQAMALSVPSESLAATEVRAKSYGGDQVKEEESAREAKRAQGLAEYRRILVDGPVLRLPLRHANTTFDPRGLVPFGPTQTVYPMVQIMDDWGTLDAKGPVLIDRAADTVSAPSPEKESQPMTGRGWTLTLEAGWKVVPDKRPGDLQVVKQR